MSPRQPDAVRTVSCPRCGKTVVWSRNSPYRPFCSERCKLLDLGAWAEEAYRIPIAESKDHPEADEPGDNK